MTRFRFFLILLFCADNCFSQTIHTDTLFSSVVKDNFIITIRKPPGFAETKTYHHVYIVDGSIGIGEYILGKTESWKADIPPTCLIIAISHIGDWHEKRNRDFVPTDLQKNSTTKFGNADRFYLFLKNELIPSIEKKFPTKKDRSFIGHSLGGLFCLYTLFQDDPLFDRHYAISPSIWANHHELAKIELNFFKERKELHSCVALYVGGLEFLNKVLPATRNLHKTMLERKYEGLNIDKREFANANHFSVRKPAVDKIFEMLKD